MNPKYLGVRMDRPTGNIFLVEQKLHQPVKRIKDITQDVLLVFCAELLDADNCVQLTREVRFSDQTAIRITVDLLEDGAPIAAPINEEPKEEMAA